MPSLDEVKPWGRSLAEYRAMFALTESDLSTRILDCGGGPASFNAEGTELGGNVVSADPLYDFSAKDINARIKEITPAMVEHVTTDRDLYVWTTFDSPEEMIDARLTTMQRFLADYETGRTTGRYRALALPSLPFANDEFELALCSHLLFTYSVPLSFDFHLAAVRELARVATEARIFPLLNSDGKPSPHLAPLVSTLLDEGYDVQQQRVSYEFQRNGNHMLVVTKPSN